MYLTGNFINYGCRLHQLPTSDADLLKFRIEGSGYLPNWNAGQKRRYSKEINKKYDVVGNTLNTGFYF